MISTVAGSWNTKVIWENWIVLRGNCGYEVCSACKQTEKDAYSLSKSCFQRAENVNKWAYEVAIANSADRGGKPDVVMLWHCTEDQCVTYK